MSTEESNNDSNNENSSLYEVNPLEDNDIVIEWKGYRPGILSYPVSLQLQCLLFIIGNIFNLSRGYCNTCQ